MNLLSSVIQNIMLSLGCGNSSTWKQTRETMVSPWSPTLDCDHRTEQGNFIVAEESPEAMHWPPPYQQLWQERGGRKVGSITHRINI